MIQKYPLKVRQERFLPDGALQLPDWFIENLNFSLDMKFVDENEAFFCESCVVPMDRDASTREKVGFRTPLGRL